MWRGEEDRADREPSRPPFKLLAANLSRVIAFHANSLVGVVIAIHCWFCFVLFWFVFFFFFLLLSRHPCVPLVLFFEKLAYGADFCWVVCVCFVFVLRWWVWLAGHPLPPLYEDRKRESALPSMVCESGHHLPFGSAFRLSVRRGVPERQMGEVLFCVCVLYGCPRLRGS